MDAQIWFYRSVLSADIGKGVKISLRAKIDFTNPKGIHIGDETYVAFGAVIFSHDMSRVVHLDTYIGRRCFIGAQSIIMPGVKIGDECIIGSGAVVTKDVPSGSIVVGNPAQIVRSGIQTIKWGILRDRFEEKLARSNAVVDATLLEGEDP